MSLKQVVSTPATYVIAAAIAFNPCTPNANISEPPATNLRPLSQWPHSSANDIAFCRTVSEWEETDMLLKYSNESSYNPLLQPLLGLKTGWDSYGAEPPNESALSISDRILSLLSAHTLAVDGIVPSPEGGVGIVFYHDERYADIEIFNNGEILAVVDDKIEKPDVWDVSNDTDDIVATLDKIHGFLNA